MTNPGFVGLPWGNVHEDSFVSKSDAYLTSLRVFPESSTLIFPLSPKGGYAIRPVLTAGFRSCGHCRVNAHHATSKIKLLPSPLSPVNIFTLLEKVRSNLSDGPTFSIWRRFNMVICTYFSTLRANVNITSRALARITLIRRRQVKEMSRTDMLCGRCSSFALHFAPVGIQ